MLARGLLILGLVLAVSAAHAQSMRRFQPIATPEAVPDGQEAVENVAAVDHSHAVSAARRTSGAKKVRPGWSVSPAMARIGKKARRSGANAP